MGKEKLCLISGNNSPESTMYFETWGENRIETTILNELLKREEFHPTYPSEYLQKGNRLQQSLKKKDDVTPKLIWRLQKSTETITCVNC